MSKLSKETPLEKQQNGVWNVRDFGAVGDGIHKDTQAIQSAINACSASGGGIVRISSGTYLTGTLYLADNMEFCVEAGAMILASPDRCDYNADDRFPENTAFAKEHVSGAHLIIAYKTSNTSITGHGTINGNSKVFLDISPEDAAHSYRRKDTSFIQRDWRPGQMIFFCKCRNVAARDVTLLNAPYWTLFFFGCDTVKASGLTITSPAMTREGDGLDIDCCRGVVVSDCIIRTGDDCITLRGNCGLLGEEKPCEDVVITNCILSTPCNAFRIGVGDGIVRNCVISNIVIDEARTGLNIVCNYMGLFPHGTRIENISISNVVMNVVMPANIDCGEGTAAPAGLYNITLSDFRVTADAGFFIGGFPGIPAMGITLRNWDMTLRGGADNDEFIRNGVPLPYPVGGNIGVGDRPALPCAVFVAYAEDIVIENMVLRWGELRKAWRDGLSFRHVKGLTIEGGSLCQPFSGIGAAIHVQECDDVSVRGVRAARGTATFFLAEDMPQGSRICCTGNDLREAETAFEPQLSPLRLDTTGNVRNATNLVA